MTQQETHLPYCFIPKLPQNPNNTAENPSTALFHFWTPLKHPETQMMQWETHSSYCFIPKLTWNLNDAVGNPSAMSFHSQTLWNHPKNVQNRMKWWWIQLLPYFFLRTLRIPPKLNKTLLLLWTPVPLLQTPVPLLRTPVPLLQTLVESGDSYRNQWRTEKYWKTCTVLET